MATLQEIILKLTADSSSLQRELNRANRLGNDYYKSMEKRSQLLDAKIAANNQSLKTMNAQFKVLGNSALSAAKSLSGGFGVENLLNRAADWEEMSVRIKISLQSIEGSADNYQQVQERLMTISNRSGKAIGDSQGWYLSIASSMQDLGYNTSETLDFIESMSNSYAINAVAAENVKSSMNAINEAMVTGTISSKQWSTLLATTPNIADALANSMDKASIDINELGKNGQISIHQLAQAMINAKDVTGIMVDDMGSNYKRSLASISNNLTQLVGQFDQSYGITRNLAKGLDLIADNMQLITIAGGGLAAIKLSRYFGNLSESVINATKTLISNRVAQISLAQSQLEAVKSLQIKAAAELNAARIDASRASDLLARCMAQVRLNQAIKKATVANDALAKSQAKVNALTSNFGLLSSAGKGLLGLLGGPVGLVATIISLGGAFMMMSNKAEEAKKPLDSLQLPIDELLNKYKSLDRASQSMIVTDLTKQIRLNSEDNDEQINQIENKLKDIFKETVGNDDGTYQKAAVVYPPEKMKEIAEYITLLRLLKKSQDETNISPYDYGNNLDDANQKLMDALGLGKEFREVLNELTRKLLDNSKSLAENQEKLAGVTKLTIKAGQSTEQLGSISFSNLNNQLTSLNNQLINLNQKIELNKFKTNETAETIYVYEGLLAAAGSAASEHSEELLKLAKNGNLAANISKEQANNLAIYIAKLKEKFLLEESIKTSEAYNSQLNNLNNQILAHTYITEQQKLEQQLTEGNLSKLEEQEKVKLRIKAQELEQLEARKEYRSILDSLRTPNEQQLDTYRSQLDFINKANLSLEERQIIIDKMFAKSQQSVPNLSLNTTYNGVGSELITVIQDDKNLNDWHQQQLDDLKTLLDEKKILQENYEKQVLNIEEIMYKKQQDLQSAYAIASLGTFSTLTGSIADMFKQTAGESSSAYKAMFLASRAAAIAQATISTFVAANKAREIGEPHGEAAAALVMGLGMANVGMIAAQTISGMAHSGIDCIPNEGTWLLDKGERVVDARTNADLKNFLQASNNSGGNLTVNVPVNINDGSVSEDDAKALGGMIRQSVLSIIDNEKRPGGRLNRL